MEKRDASILMVDDDKDVLMAAEALLSRHFAKVRIETDPRQLPGILDNVDVLILDMNFAKGNISGREGLFWLKKVLELNDRIGVIMMTAYAEIELAVESISMGAIDFIEKPWNDYKLVQTVINALELKQTKNEINLLRNKNNNLIKSINQDYDLIVGSSPIMRKVFSTINKVSDVDANILILGDNGTGKELIAREIHRKSSRKNEAFISIDMGSVHENLFESELFGHIQGAFTDARNDKTGKFVLADGGTLFLDEIGNLPMTLQAKLLSVLQNRVITPVGAVKPIPIDIRLICATNKPLYQMVPDGLFREDLLFRINTIQINIPPLSERREDIPVLTKFYFDKYKVKYKKPHLSIRESTIRKLTEMDWSGNIRQLKNTIESSVILSEGDYLTPTDIQYRSVQYHSTTKFPIKSLEENERDYISVILEKYSGNISKVATALGVARSTIYQKMKRYGL